MQSAKRVYASSGTLLKRLLLPCLWLASIPMAEPQDVLTQHNDNARTGQYLNETILTPINVNSSTFGRLFTLSVDGKVDAQPLYVSNVAVPGNGTHNLLIVPTEHDSVYAFDADTGTAIWTVSLLKSGETTSDARNCDQVVPEIGVTATPVIDRTRGPHGAIYVIAMSKSAASNYFQRLHALDLATGAELFGGPKDVQATFPGNGAGSVNGNVIFDAKQYKERMGLLLFNGTVYTAWSSHCDIDPYTGWVMAYDASTLAQKNVLNVVPNGNEGAMWSSGGGLAADSLGNIYVLDGNGDFDPNLNAGGFPSNGNFGNGFLKISTSSGLAVADYFEMFNQAQENNADVDLGSGGALVLPDMTDGAGQVRHLVIGAGKDTNIYLLNRDSMGKFDSNSNNVYQELSGALSGGVWSMPAYFNNRIYYGPVGDPIFAFQFTNARLATNPVAQTLTSFGYPGATPSVSANGTSNGIVWASASTNPAVLHAYDAADLHELYNSNQASGGRDHFGAGITFATPTIASGKVYVGTRTGVGVFGLLPSGGAPAVSLSPTKLAFTPQLTNTSSANRNVTLKNVGTGTLSISSITASGNFSQTNTCGTSLAAGMSCTISVTFRPTVPGSIPGAITVIDDAPQSPQIVGLTGTGVNSVSFSQTGLNFGTVTAGTTSAPRTITLNNNQATAVTFTFTTTSSYQTVGGGTNPCGTSLAGKAKCTFSVTFSPKQNGNINGTLSVSGASFATQLANMSGAGASGATAPLKFLAANLTFPGQLLGTTSAGKTVTVTNISAGTVTISSLGASANFTATGSGASPCGGALTPSSKCTFTVTFSPSMIGFIKGAVAVTNSSTLSPQIYNMSGTGVSALSFSPSSVVFPATPVGTASAPLTVTLTNNQSTSLTITSIVPSGQYTSTPGGSSPCGSALAAHAKCTVNVTFAPSSTGTISGAVTLTHSAGGSPQAVKLTGTGQ